VATHEEKLAHLERLAEELKHREFTAEVVTVEKPYLRVANASTPTLNERVRCEQAEDGTWVFWWPWHQPIGSVDDVAAVAGKITAVLRSVDGGHR
jgi:hypothetical protein